MLILWLAACAGGTDTGDAPVTLTAVQEEVFTPSCTFSTCHAASSPAAGLDLTAGASHAALVGVASADADGETLVIPGDADGSYLVRKLAAASGIVGDEMPPQSGGLDADRLARVRAWIDGGALDE